MRPITCARLTSPRAFAIVLGLAIVAIFLGGTAAADEVFTNESVIAMIKIGLSEAVIVAKISSSTSKKFDLSTAGLIALKQAGASDRVIEAMLAPPGAVQSELSRSTQQTDDQQSLLPKRGRPLLYNVRREIAAWQRSGLTRGATDRLTIVNEGETTLDGVTTTQISESYKELWESSRRSYVVVTSDGIALIRSERTSDPIRSRQLFQPWMLRLKEPLQAGSTWEYKGVTIGVGGRQSEYQATFQVAGRERTTVPAGQFDALKIVVKWAGTASAGTYAEWWVRGVGMVMREVVSSTHREVAELSE